RQARPRLDRGRRQDVARRNRALQPWRPGRPRAQAAAGARRHRHDDHRGRRVLDGRRHRRRPRTPQDLAEVRRRARDRRRTLGRRARLQRRRHRGAFRPGRRSGPDRGHVLQVARLDRRIRRGVGERHSLPAASFAPADLHGGAAPLEHRRRARRPARDAARARAPRATVAQHAPAPGGDARARLRHRSDRDTDHSRAHRAPREDVPVLAEAVRCRCVHEPGRSARGPAIPVPPAHQPDGDTHGRADRSRARRVRPPRKRAGGHLTAVEVTPVTGGRDLNRFIAFPYDHYRDDPLWVPQLRRDVRILLTPGKNPFWEHAEAQLWTARRPDGRMVGRIGAIKNDMHNKVHEDRVGFYGFFESIDDQSVANALFDTAAAWLRAKGFDTMRGPMNPSTNDDCGLLIENDGTPPSLMMPYNFSYYERLHEAYGFKKAKDLLAYYGGGGESAPERFLRLGQRALKRSGIRLRTLNKKRFDDEVELIKKLYNSAWEKNWGFVPLTDAEIDHLAKQLKPIVVP